MSTDVGRAHGYAWYQSRYGGGTVLPLLFMPTARLLLATTVSLCGSAEGRWGGSTKISVALGFPSILGSD